MTYAELAERLGRLDVRLGLKLVVESPRARLDDETRAAIAEHKPLIVARVAHALQRTALASWEWGQGDRGGPPPF